MLSSIMPAALQVDWNEVRTLAIAIGVREAARRMGISEDAVMQRSKREGWLKQHSEQQAEIEAIRADIRTSQGLSATVSKAADVLKEIGNESRIHFAKASNKVAKKLSTMDEDELLTQGQTAVQFAKVAQLAHGWRGAEAGETLRLEMIARAAGESAEVTVQASVERVEHEIGIDSGQDGEEF